jgi:glycosyltransferase involved in cell wall biosynthesis
MDQAALKYNMRALATIGDAASPRAWSGTPYYFYQAAARSGFLQVPLHLDPSKVKAQRRWFHLRNLLRFQRARGFQYTEAFNHAMLEQFQCQVDGMGVTEIVSHYPLFPPMGAGSSPSQRVSFYIDSPLQALFTQRKMDRELNRRVMLDAIHREKQGFHACERVISMAKWSTDYLATEYGIPQDKLFTVLPGANLPEESVQTLLAQRGPKKVPQVFSDQRPLRIGFTGKDWERKGLPRLVGALEVLKKKGLPVELHVIGYLAERFKKMPFVRWRGFVDKVVEEARFLEVLDSFDIGCFPSHQEPMGIAPLECLRLGIPVICTAQGGLVDACPADQGAGILAGSDPTPEGLAAMMEPLLRDAETLQILSDSAWRIREHYRWERTVSDMQRIWDGDTSQPR